MPMVDSLTEITDVQFTRGNLRIGKTLSQF
jgi:hypothetical protein